MHINHLSMFHVLSPFISRTNGPFLEKNLNAGVTRIPTLGNLSVLFYLHFDQIEALFSFRHQVEYCSLPCSTPGILKVCLASVNLLDQFVEWCRGGSILMHEILR
jgi:hypothetical protein